MQFLGIIFLNFLLFIGLKYRWAFSISMLITLKLLKFMFNKNATLQLMLTGLAIAVFPILPVVGTQRRIYIV
jgi:hypothetical protein